MKMKKQKYNKKVLVTGLACLALLAVGLSFGAYYFTRDKNDSSTVINIEAENAKDNKELKDGPGEKNPQTPSEEKENTPKQNETDSLTTVTPFISYFGRTESQLEVNAIVPNINEDGICTLVVRNSSKAIVYTASKPARAGAQTTRCENFLFGDSGANEQWTAIVTYKSQQYKGESQPTAFK